MCALNLTRSPENGKIWVTADRFDLTSRPCGISRHRRADSEPPGSQTASSQQQSWSNPALREGSWVSRPSMDMQRDRSCSNVFRHRSDVEGMVNNYSSIFLRRQFTVGDPGAPQNLILSADFSAWRALEVLLS